jgi:hypothetical protein
MVTKYRYLFFRNKFVETLEESVNLFLHLLVHLEESKIFKVAELVIIGDCDVSTTRDEFFLLVFTKEVLVDTEFEIKALYVVLDGPLAVSVVVVVHVFKVCKVELLAYHALVKRLTEVALQ